MANTQIATEDVNELHPKSAEAGIVWSTLLTPIAGAIYWSSNWKRIGKPQHRWWTLVSGIIIALITIVLSIYRAPIIGVIIALLWTWGMYTIQKRSMPKWIYSITALVFGIIFTLFQIGDSIYLKQLSVANGGAAPALTVGSSFDANSSDLSVSGANVTSGQIFYVRLQTPHPFGTSQLTYQLQEQNGSGWTVALQQNEAVVPNYNIQVEKFVVNQPGTYQVDVLNGNNIIAQQQFAVH